jgi:hypothetical protein
MIPTTYISEWNNESQVSKIFFLRHVDEKYLRNTSPLFSVELWDKEHDESL